MPTKRMVIHQEGSVILTPDHRLAIVVDETAGKRWLKEDPMSCVNEPSPEEATAYCIVRLLGDVIASGSDEWDPAIIPKREPNRRHIAHFKYVQMDLCHRICDPDPNAIGILVGYLELGRDLFDVKDRSGFITDLKIIHRYLLDDDPEKWNPASYNRRYLLMLKELLPNCAPKDDL